MKRFYIIIGGYLILLTVIVFIPIPVGVKWVSFGVSVTLLLAVLAYGASNIRSQVFVRTTNSGDRSGKQVAITFDDGPHPDKSAKILEVLEHFDSQATFFLIGSRLEGNENVVKLMSQSGHSIGNHSFSHSNLFPIYSSRKINFEIKETNRLLESITGKRITFFRPPFGVTNPRISRGLKGQSLKVIGWSIRSFDTRNEPAEKVVNRIMKKIRGGDIILLHETSDHILEILEMLLSKLKKMDMTFVGMDQLMKETN
jgi:peptidoglycan/xylan/chitin deacetylase (PgdA/CDA1 family)